MLVTYSEWPVWKEWNHISYPIINFLPFLLCRWKGRKDDGTNVLSYLYLSFFLKSYFTFPENETYNDVFNHSISSHHKVAENVSFQISRSIMWKCNGNFEKGIWWIVRYWERVTFPYLLARPTELEVQIRFARINKWITLMLWNIAFDNVIQNGSWQGNATNLAKQVSLHYKRTIRWKHFHSNWQIWNKSHMYRKLNRQ